MISRLHNWRRRRKVLLLAAVAGAFLLSASFAVVLNSQGNSGEQVAEAASRVNRQVDDTQEAFTDIRDLIPEEQRLEAAPPASYDHQLTAGAMPAASAAGPGRQPSRRRPRPCAAGRRRLLGGPTYGIDPASGAAGEAVFSLLGAEANWVSVGGVGEELEASATAEASTD